MKNKKSVIVTIIAVLFGIAIILAFYIVFFPFARLSLIESDYDSTMSQYKSIIDYEQRAGQYKKMMFLHKGMTINAICQNGEKATIHLGWDNSINIKKGKQEKNFVVDKMYFFSHDNGIYKHDEDFIIVEREADKDSTYVGVAFSNSKNDTICIYKQPDNLPFGGQEFGFSIKVDDWNFSSGNMNYFERR